jgi:primosomal protein DnaI
MKDIYPDDKSRFSVIKKLKDFIDNYMNKKPTKGLYLHGSFGGGKTYLISAMFNELAKKDIKSVIVYWPELLRSLKEAFNSDDYETMFSRIKKAPLLLIDDIGAENLTSWGRDEILGSILQYRMQEELPTFFTSNLNIKELEEHLSFSNGRVDKVKARRIIERINQLTEDIEMISENKRG